MAHTLAQLNSAPPAAAAAMLEGLYEQAPWIAESALRSRPFRSLAELRQRMRQAVDEADAETRLALVRAHPEPAHLPEPGAAYRERFGFPFVLAPQGPRGTDLTRQEIADEFARREGNPPEVELQEALHQLHRVAEIRLQDRFAEAPAIGNDIWDWGERLAAHSDPGYAEKGQLTVTYLTDAHRACAGLLSQWMRDCGFDEVGIDAVGNVVGRYLADRADAPTLMTGSHYDTVRNAGKYDGRLGIFVPMACVRELSRAGRRLPYHLEVIGFAEEEGQRYRATFLGSGALIGGFREEWLAQQDADGVSMREAMARAGLRPRTSRRCAAIRRATWASSKSISNRVPCSTRWGCRWPWSRPSTAACATRSRFRAWPATPAPRRWTGAATPPPRPPRWCCTWSGAPRSTAIRSAQ